eukprot:3139065-Pleurochrysis_carterae.AAC.3
MQKGASQIHTRLEQWGIYSQRTGSTSLSFLRQVEGAQHRNGCKTGNGKSGHWRRRQEREGGHSGGSAQGTSRQDTVLERHQAIRKRQEAFAQYPGRIYRNQRKRCSPLDKTKQFASEEGSTACRDLGSEEDHC